MACQAPLTMEFSRQEYWTGLLCFPSGDLPDLGIEPVSLKSPVLAGNFFFFFFKFYLILLLFFNLNLFILIGG